MLRKLVATSPTWALLPLRLGLGLVFIAHGLMKVFGVWGGSGLRAFVANPAPFQFMRPAWLWMGAAALGELVGGALVLLGLFTRVGAFLIAAVMLTAILGVHWGAFFLSNKGFEYALALFMMSLALLIAGAGQASIDQKLMRTFGRR